jgi:TetR/AcrR family transcriptional repressor of nem operon
MRISKEKAAENRAALVKAASKLFRERGIDGVGVAEISKEAGLTHGALYAHFKSKGELALAALAFGFEQSHARMATQDAGGTPELSTYLDACLSLAGRDDYAGGCPMAASASEIGRHDTALSHHYAEGYMGIVRAFERHIMQQEPGGDALARAMVAVAALIGGLAVARGAAKGNPAVSEQVLKATREMIDVLIQAGDSI